MITITDEQLDAMANVLYQSDREDHKYDVENVYAYEVHRVAVETWLTKHIDSMVQDIWFWAYGPASIGRYQAELQLVARK